MRIKSILWMLVMACSIMALDQLPNPYGSESDSIHQLLLALVLLLFLTPFGWGLMAVVIISIIIAIVKGVKKAVTTDYSIIPEEDKRDALLDELSKAARGDKQ